MLSALFSRFAPTTKSKLRAAYYSVQQAFVDTFRSYGTTELLATLRGLGIESGDTLMVHAGFSRRSGFKGSPTQLIDGHATIQSRAIASAVPE